MDLKFSCILLDKLIPSTLVSYPLFFFLGERRTTDPITPETRKEPKEKGIIWKPLKKRMSLLMVQLSADVTWG